MSGSKKIKVNEYKLVSDNGNGANYTDPNLLNSWGIVIHDGYLWTTANNKDLLIRYDLTGNNPYDILFYNESGTLLSNTTSAVVNPTGIVINHTKNYLITDGTNTHKSTFLIASESGDLFGYNKHVGGGNKAYRIYAGSTITPSPPVYKGLAVTDKYLFAADFMNGNVDVFVKSNTPNSLNLDAHISKYGLVSPTFAAPFNIVSTNDVLFVLYAYKATATSHDDNSTGGFIDIHNEYGIYVNRFSSDTALVSPWGLIDAPKDFDRRDGTILVGNFGSGQINSYNRGGTRIGQVYLKSSTTPLVLSGLWGLYNYCDKLYFASGPNSEADGLVGYLVSAYSNRCRSFDPCDSYWYGSYNSCSPCNPCGSCRSCNSCNPCKPRDPCKSSYRSYHDSCRCCNYDSY